MGSISNRFNVKKYGAKGDGVTDDYSAIMLAFADAQGSDAPSQYATTIYFPFGHYVFSRPIRLTHCRGLIFRTEPGTVLEYTGSSTTGGGAIQLEGTNNVLEGFHLIATADIGIRNWRMTPVSDWITSMSTFRDIEFSGSYGCNISIDSRNSFLRWSITIATATTGQTVSFNCVDTLGATVPVSYVIPPASTTTTVATAVAALINAIGGIVVSSSGATITAYSHGGEAISFNTAVNCSISSTGASTGNNDYSRFINCSFRNYGEVGAGPDGVGGAGVYLFGAQVHVNRFFRCRFDGEDRADNQKFGIYARYGAYLSCFGCDFRNNYLDVWLYDFLTVNCFRYCTSTNSGQFMRIGVGASGPTPVEISDCTIDHGAYLAATETGYNPLSIFCGRAGPLSVLSSDFRATNLNPMISSRGLSVANMDGPRVDGCRFAGVSDYYRDITTVVVPTNGQTTKYQGHFDMSNTTRRYAEGTDNLHWNVTSSAYERIDVQQFFKPAGIYSGPTPTRNFVGYVDFPDGGAQQQTEPLPVSEADNGYHLITAVEITAGVTTTSYTAKVEAGKTAGAFDVRLSAPPVGSDVRVHWFLTRAA